MISTFRNRNPIKILIPIRNCSLFFTRRESFVLFFALVYLFLCFRVLFVFSSFIVEDEGKELGRNATRAAEEAAMKVHPAPTKKRNNVAFTNGGGSLRNSRNLLTGTNKKLRRLPHIFPRVLELPFGSDADVDIQESSDCFTFVAETNGIGEVRAHMIQIHPGVTKIVVRPNGYVVELSSLDELELDRWRFRLPESTRPELASAVFADGELIVTVPKGAETDSLEERDGSGARRGGGNGEFRGGMGNNRLVLVQ